MKHQLILVFHLLITLSISAQCPTGNLTLGSQTAVNNFLVNYPTCTALPANLTINGTTISDLTPLANLTSIGGDLRIISSNNITNYTGLNNLTTIVGALRIDNHDGLTNGNVFSNLITLGSFSLSNCQGLTLWGSFDHLTSIGDVSINNCDNMITAPVFPLVTSIGNVSLTGNTILTQVYNFGSPTTVNGSLTVSNCDALFALVGFENIQFISGDVIIQNNNILPSLNGLSGISSISGQLLLLNNDGMITPTGLSALNNVGNNVTFDQNNMMTSLSGINNLSTVGGNLLISANVLLSSLAGLDNLTTINGNLFIAANTALTSLGALSNLTAINGGQLAIQNQTNLTSLTGLDNIDDNTLQGVYIYYNTVLSMCDVQSICEYVSVLTNTADFIANAVGCNSRMEVYNDCLGILPVYFKKVEAKDGYIHWQVEQEINVSHYEVEISLDGLSYFVDNHVTVDNSDNNNYKSKILKTKPYPSNCRIKSIDYDGKYQYSEIIGISYNSNLDDDFTFYVNGDIIYLTTNNNENWTIFDSYGYHIMSISNNQANISNLPSGLFFLQQNGSNKTKKWLKF